jgi:lipopolysaccharide export system protein LptA
MPRKIRAFMKHPLSTRLLVLALALVLAPAVAMAEKADRDKPMNIEADALRYDDLRQTSVFTGRVVGTKGTIVIRGARVEVRQDPEGYQFGTVVAEPGKLAYWRQKREGLDEYIEGEGETIEYDGRADRVKFIGRAEMRRLRGAQLADEMRGSVITYENTTDVFKVDGTVAGAKPAEPGGRVRAVLAPRGPSSAPVSSATRPAVSAAPAPATLSGTNLRPSTTLGGERQ